MTKRAERHVPAGFTKTDEGLVYPERYEDTRAKAGVPTDLSGEIERFRDEHDFETPVTGRNRIAEIRAAQESEAFYG